MGALNEDQVSLFSWSAGFPLLTMTILQKYMCLKNTVMARDAQPKELAGAFLYLASQASSYTTGTEIVRFCSYEWLENMR